jgi:hypothetical protein
MKPPQPGQEPTLAPDVERVLQERLGAAPADDHDLLQRVKARVMGTVRAESSPYRTVRAGEGWETVAPGIERKLLWVLGDQRSCLMRFAPGAVVDRHFHRADEECVVLEGTVRIGELELHAGDFHLGREGSDHPVSTTDTGAVIYLRGALDP